MQVKYQLIWNKPSAGLGMGDYRSKHEPFFYANVKDQTPNFYGDRTNTSVIDFQKTDEQLMRWVKKQREAEKDNIIQKQAEKINELQNIIVRHHDLLTQIVEKLNKPSI